MRRRPFTGAEADNVLNAARTVRESLNANQLARARRPGWSTTQVPTWAIRALLDATDPAYLDED